MSQSALGAALGVTLQQIQKYESGKNRISASRLQQMAGVLEVSVSFFFEGSPGQNGVTSEQDAPPPAYVGEVVASSDGLALVKAFRRIKDFKVRRSIVTLVEHIASEMERTLIKLTGH